jgi:hypothetical protein
LIKNFGTISRDCINNTEKEYAVKLYSVSGGVKINAMENSSTFSFGDTQFVNIDSQNKTNVMNQLFGDFDVVNQQPIASTIYDPDGVDTSMPMVQRALGLED